MDENEWAGMKEEVLQQIEKVISNYVMVDCIVENYIVIELIKALRVDRQKIVVLREALQFYADHQNWFAYKDCVNEIENDEGEIAREALGEDK
jgi:hypothetical protein